MLRGGSAGRDGVLTGVAGAEGLFTADTLASWKGAMLLIVDIALPRNVESSPAVEGIRVKRDADTGLFISRKSDSTSTRVIGKKDR